MNIRATHAAEIEEPETEGFVADYLLYLLAAASDAASGDFHAHVREHGLRVPEWRVLACLSDRDGQMITQLAQLALMEQSRLTKIIDQMVVSGWVTRRDDKRDRRRVRVYLTENGRRLAEKLVADARAHERRICEQLPAGDAALLKEALRHIKRLYDPAEPGSRHAAATRFGDKP